MFTSQDNDWKIITQDDIHDITHYLLQNRYGTSLVLTRSLLKVYE